MKPTILMIEDNQDLIDIYTTRFNEAGITVEVERDGLAGMMKIAESEPDLILLDIMMPEMNGFEILEGIQNNLSQEKKIPVVVWSNLYEEKDEARAMELGASKYLRKSDYKGQDLVMEIKNILGL